MMKKFAAFILILSLTSCFSRKYDKETSEQVPYQPYPMENEYAFYLEEISEDETYGYTVENPVMVGGAHESIGPINERRYLNALCGPEGEDIWYQRLGSCCQFKSPNGIMGNGLLDKYQVSWEESEDTVIIFINMYDQGPLLAPMGLEIKDW